MASDIKEYAKRQGKREALYMREIAKILRTQYRVAGRAYARDVEVPDLSKEFQNKLESLHYDVMVDEFFKTKEFYVEPLLIIEKKSWILDTARALGELFDGETLNSILREYAKNLAILKIVEMMTTTRERLVAIQEEFEGQGATRREIGRLMELEGNDINSRARTIARTETTEAANLARSLGIASSGYEYEKIWESAMDSHVRNSHTLMHSFGYIPFNQLYEVPSRNGYDLMLQPHDVNGSPENVINCRCILVFRPILDRVGVPKGH